MASPYCQMSAQLQSSARHIAACEEAYRLRVAAGTWQPVKLHAYNGQLLHEASSAVTRTQSESGT